MNAIWLGKRIYSKLPSTVLGLVFLSILNIILFTPLGHAQSCSVTSMQAGGGIRACQIEDLRTLINEARAACASGAIAPYTYSDDPIIPGQTAISVRHVEQMKTAINEISSACIPTRTPRIFPTISIVDIISVMDFAYIFNAFVSTDFCGDGICQTSEEDLTTCPVDCGGTAQFYCNNIGGCYASATCPPGNTCYAAAQDCLDEAPTDCPVACVPNCDCARYQCVENTCSDGCGGTCAGTKLPDCSDANDYCVGEAFSDGCGGTCTGTGTAAPDCSCESDTCVGRTCSDRCGGMCAGTKVCGAVINPPQECKKYTCSDDTWCLQDYTETCSCPAGQVPVCVEAPSTACGGGSDCPDTTCQCIN
jgi:hypothetical protein